MAYSRKPQFTAPHYLRTNYEPSSLNLQDNQKPVNTPEEPLLEDGRTIKWKPEYKLRSTAALLARKRDFKTLSDIRNAIESPTFESDPDLIDQIIHRGLACCGGKTNRPFNWFGRWIWRILTINGTTPYVWMKILNSFSSPAVLAVMSTLLHAKDAFEGSNTILKASGVKTQGIDPAKTVSFLDNIGISLLIIFGIVLTMELAWKIQYWVVITLKNHRTILRETRFEQLQTEYDLINPYGNDWTWEYNALDEDPDLAMIYFQYKDEYNNAERNCCGYRYADVKDKARKKLPLLKYFNKS